MKTILSTLLIFNGLISNGQTIEILKQSDTWKQIESKDFDFLGSSVDSNALDYVATIRVSGDDKDAKIEALFNLAMNKANALGANCFKYNNHIESSKPRKAALTLDLYHATDSILNINIENREKNLVYLFTGEKYSDENHTFKINKTKTLLKAGTYIRRIIEEGQELKINIGGFTGATMLLNWKENKPTKFLTLTTFGVSNRTYYSGASSVTFNTGRINFIETNFGYLLTQIMSESKNIE